MSDQQTLKQTSTPERLWTIKDVARYLNVSLSTAAPAGPRQAAAFRPGSDPTLGAQSAT
jgi:hypothetical protein